MTMFTSCCPQIAEFLRHPQVSEFNRHIALCYLQHLSAGGMAFVPQLVSSFHSTEEKNLVYSISSVAVEDIEGGVTRGPQFSRSESECTDCSTDSDT